MSEDAKRGSVDVFAYVCRSEEVKRRWLLLGDVDHPSNDPTYKSSKMCLYDTRERQRSCSKCVQK